MDENTTIKALPIYKKLIELAGEAEDLSDKASTITGLTKINQRGRHSAFLEAAAMVKESTK